MKSYQLTLAACKGEPHPRVPVDQHSLTGRIRQCGITVEQFQRDPGLTAWVAG